MLSPSMCYHHITQYTSVEFACLGRAAVTIVEFSADACLSVCALSTKCPLVAVALPVAGKSPVDAEAVTL